jgi:sialidase-1
MPEHIKRHQKESSHASNALLRGILGSLFVLVLFHWTVVEIQAGGKGVPMSQTPLFWAGQDGCNTYRIPALAVTPKGTLLAFCEARRDSQRDWGNIDLVLRRSLDQGKTWEPVQVIVDDDGNTCGNPCPIVDRKNGAVILLLTKNNSMENEGQILQGSAAPRTVWSTISRDEGFTWSAPHEISNQVRRPDWRWYATGPCHGIQLTDGRLIAPCDHATSPDHEDMHSHIIYSDDGGDNWKIGGILEKLTNECAVVELMDGSLYLNARSYHGTHRRCWSKSQDRGMTWSPVAEDPTLIEPVCQGSVLGLSDQKSPGASRVLFSNPASVHRENLTIRMSTDQCMSWPLSKTLWLGPAAYSDLVNIHEGLIGCLFECGQKQPYETITFARFTTGWINSGTSQ